MNNQQFRKLVLDTPSRAKEVDDARSSYSLGGKKASRPGSTTGSHGLQVDFARQMRERHAALQPTKKFKSTAPKGSRFSSGYVDRAKARADVAEDNDDDDNGESDDDDKAKRIKALEEQVKLGELSIETFEALRDEITGGDIASTHLVKGLDRKLLERVRRGEDVLGLGTSRRDSDEGPADVDDELDKLEEQTMEAVKKEKAEKKGELAPKALAGTKRSRNDILTELKAQRKAAAEEKAKLAPQFDHRWRKVGEKMKPKIEIDHKGREVLITMDEDGIVKKKVRKLPSGNKKEDGTVLPTLDASRPVLGADVVIPASRKLPVPVEDEDDDIFAGAGTEYNPLGDEEEEGDSDEDESSPVGKGSKTPPKQASVSNGRSSESQEDAENTATSAGEEPEAKEPPRKYFQDTISTAEDSEQNRFKGIERVLEKAAKMGSGATAEDGSDGTEEHQERLAKRAKMLASQDRDMDDLDLGFGSSRFEDGEDAEGGKKTRLSEWKNKHPAGDDDDDEGGWEEDEKSNKKKRKPKKRKGDANNVDDIMRVIEGRKAAGK